MNRLTLGLAVALFGIATAGLAQPTQQARRVTRIDVAGLERVSEQVVRSKIEVQVNEPLNPRAVARDIRRLYDLGFFANIKVESDPDNGGVVLTYLFEEKRVIDEIRIIGNEKIKDRKVRGVLTWREGDTFLPEGYDSERKAILDHYQEKGFANAAVDIIAEKIGPSRVRITYAIQEGKKARIRSIKFEGNDALTRREVKKAMKTRAAWWFIGGRYKEEKFEADLENILDAYGDAGHLEAAIPRTDVVYTDDGKGMHITIRLDEGAEYSVGTLKIAGNQVYDDDEMRDVIEVHEDEVHNRGQVSEDAANLQKNYEDSGYVNADVVPQVVLDREQKTTHVVHDVQEGDLKYVRQIDISGNEITKDEVIRRRILLKPGDRFDGSLVKLSQRRIDNTGYFEKSRLTLGNMAEEDLWTDLLVDVEEGKTGTFNFGVGYSTDARVAGYGELRLTNVDLLNWPTFSGGGQRLSVRLQEGSRRDEYRISFTDPEAFGYPVLVGGDLFSYTRIYRDGADFREEQSGGQLRVGKVLSTFARTNVTVLYEDTDISDIPDAFQDVPLLENLAGSSTTLSLGWDIERDTLDNPRVPSTGANHLLRMQLAGFGADNEFYKIEHESEFFWPLEEEQTWVLSYRTREGWVTPYGGSDLVPLQDRYFAGGTSTIRGYDIRDVGPKVTNADGRRTAVGGELFLVNNLEVQYRVTDILRLYGFGDAGGVWMEASDFDLGDIRYSVGLGIGFDVPRLGPFRLDYGFPVNPDDDQGNGRLHLATGLRF